MEWFWKREMYYYFCIYEMYQWIRMLKPAVVTAKRSKSWMSKVKNVLSALLDKVQGILCISGDAKRISLQSLSVNLGGKKIIITHSLH